MIETAVLTEIQRLKRATFASLCKELPFAKSSISYALKRLAAKKNIELKRGGDGEFWQLCRKPSDKKPLMA